MAIYRRMKAYISRVFIGFSDKKVKKELGNAYDVASDIVYLYQELQKVKITQDRQMDHINRLSSRLDGRRIEGEPRPSPHGAFHGGASHDGRPRTPARFPAHGSDNPRGVKLKNNLRNLEKFITNYQAVLARLTSGKHMAESNLEKLRKLHTKVNNELTRAGKSEDSKVDYDGLEQMLGKITFSSIASTLCIQAGKEMDEGRGPGAVNEALEQATIHMLNKYGLQFINPLAGDPYNESEHDIVDRIHGGGEHHGKIRKVHERGCRRKTDGKILRKAKIIIWDA